MFDLQPTLKNEIVKVEPLAPNDFEALFKVASDPLIWEQHPQPDRYKKEVFQNYFDGAIESKGALLIRKTESNEIIGATRFYDYDENSRSILIGYTFFAKAYWGSIYNKAVKGLMLDHAFKNVEAVYFHIGANNIRSQTSIQRLGAIKVEEKLVAYHGEGTNMNFVYMIEKARWRP
jgi:RimJ/RimL family protein N-acetyltransferase